MKNGRAFPLDDTGYLAEDLRMWFYTRTSGVYSANNNLSVVAKSGMNISVNPGIAFLNNGTGGIVVSIDDPVTLTISVANNKLSRIDNVVLRWDMVENKAGIDVVSGDLSKTAGIRPPTRNGNAYEIVIAHIYVPVGAGSISTAQILDTRLDESVCGLMRDGVTSIPTDELYSQFKAWVDSLHDVLDEETATHLLDLINTHDHDDRYYTKEKTNIQITASINKRILKGTSAPSSSMGEEGSIYVQY